MHASRARSRWPMIRELSQVLSHIDPMYNHSPEIGVPNADAEPLMTALRLTAPP